MMKRALIWGGFAAAGSAAWTLIEYALGFHTERVEVGRYTGFIGILFPIVAIVAALRSDRAEAGGMAFGRGFAQGMAVTLVFAAFGVLFFAIYFSAINPGFLDRMAAEGEPATIGAQLGLLFISSLIGGIVISLIAAVVMAARESADGREQDQGNRCGRVPLPRRPARPQAAGRGVRIVRADVARRR